MRHCLHSSIHLNLLAKNQVAPPPAFGPEFAPGKAAGLPNVELNKAVGVVSEDIRWDGGLS
jgi:hypothetical protein